MAHFCRLRELLSEARVERGCVERFEKKRCEREMTILRLDIRSDEKALRAAPERQVFWELNFNLSH